MATGLENLKIYQMAKELEMRVHNITKSFPDDERYRTTDQLRRSSSSVPSNIAESYYKRTIKERERILRDIAIGESEETRSGILRASEKDLLDGEVAKELDEGYTQLRKAIFGYIRFLKASVTHELNNS